MIKEFKNILLKIMGRLKGEITSYFRHTLFITWMQLIKTLY